MKSTELKQYTRAPKYGWFQGMTATGKEAYVNFLTTELTYNGEEYMAGELLAQAIRNEIEVALHTSKLKAMSRKIKNLEDENATMKLILAKLNMRLKKLESKNTIL